MAIIKSVRHLSFLLSLILILILILILFLNSCARTELPLLYYQQRSFKAHLMWTVGDTTASGILTVLQDGESESKDKNKKVSLEYTAPDSLAGLCITKQNETVSLSFADLTVEDEIAENMMSIASFFDIDATLTESDTEILDGIKFNRITVRSGEGKLFSILLYSATQTPHRISGELNSLPCALEILSFEFLQ